MFTPSSLLFAPYWIVVYSTEILTFDLMGFGKNARKYVGRDIQDNRLVLTGLFF